MRFMGSPARPPCAFHMNFPFQFVGRPTTNSTSLPTVGCEASTRQCSGAFGPSAMRSADLIVNGAFTAVASTDVAHRDLSAASAENVPAAKAATTIAIGNVAFLL